MKVPAATREPPPATMTGLLLSAGPLATSVFTASLWFMPALLAAVAYYKYEEIDPESRPIDRKQLYKEYDFIISKYHLHILYIDLSKS